MRYPLVLVVLVLVNNWCVKAQNAVDSIVDSNRLVSRIAVHGQKGYSVEAGIMWHQFQARFPKKDIMSMIAYASHGFYLSSEMVLNDLKTPLIGPKLGWELGVIGETHGSYFGAEFINYTNFSNYSPAVLLKIGIPMLWFNASYGFTMYLDDALKGDIGKHRVSLSYIINRKTKKAHQRLQNAYDKD